MRYAALRLFALAVAVCLSSGSLARADYIAQFNFTPDKTDLFATNDPTLGKITLSNESPSKAFGNTNLIATNITTESSAGKSTPAVFTDTAYTLTLYITDFKSGKTDQMYFSGKFNGNLTAGTSKFAHEFTSPQEVTKQVGDRVYTVKVGPVVLPGNPTSGKVGSIGAEVTVSAVPEPSTLVLAGLGLAVTGGGWWFRRRRLVAPGLA